MINLVNHIFEYKYLMCRLSLIMTTRAYVIAPIENNYVKTKKDFFVSLIYKMDHDSISQRNLYNCY